MDDEETGILESTQEIEIPSQHYVLSNELLQPFSVSELAESILPDSDELLVSTTDSVTELKPFVSLHTVRRVFKCKTCQKLFKTDSARSKHIAIKHGQIGGDSNLESTDHVGITGNEAAAPSSDAVVKAEPTDADDSVVCIHCCNTFLDENALQEHLRSLIDNKGVNCPHCQKVRPNECALKFHIQYAHGQDCLYQCKKCTKQFTSQNGLREHMQQHANLKIPCNDCGALLSSRTGLLLHKRRCHAESHDFECSFCSKTFPFKSQRDIHVRTHTNERPYECTTCGARFKAQSGLIVHRRTHTSERPFECKICGKRLRLGYNLKLHLRTHTGEKPYSCEMCDRAFAQSGDLKKHLNVHYRHSATT